MRAVHTSRKFAILFTLAAGVLAAAGSSPAGAGVHYKSTTHTQDAAERSRDIEVEGWVDGGKAKVEFKESGNPAFQAGTYLLTQNGGELIYLVNPEEKTYARFDLEAMMGMVGNVLQGMGGLVKFEVSEPKVEKLADEDGGKLVGLSTRHYRFRTSYTMRVKVFGMGQPSAVVTEQDVWSTQELSDAGFGIWLRKAPPRIGNEDLDRLVNTEMEKIHGWPLKMVTTSTSTGKKGKPTTTRTTMEVTLLEKTSVPASAFALPAGYKEVEMAPMVPAQ
jgi:hypothetical protein